MSLLRFPRRKSIALLAYLAAHAPKPVYRATLASLLWGTVDERRAHSSLRQELSLLRSNAINAGTEFFRSSGDAIQLANEIDVDLIAFRRALETGTKASLSAAVSLYRGHFLSDLNIADSEYQAWQAQERESYRSLLIDILDRLVSLNLEENDLLGAVNFAKMLVHQDEYRERSRSQLMRALAASGQRVAAIREYWEYHRLLGESLQVAPSSELQSMMESLRLRSTTARGDSHSAPIAPSGIPGDSLGANESIAIDHRPTIAVLPFVSAMLDESMQMLARVITGDVIGGLSGDPRLSVISYNSVARYLEEPRHTRAISDALGADYIADGRFLRAGEKLSISISLVDAQKGRELWSRKREFEESELLSAVSDAVESIVIALVSHLKLSESARFKRKPPSSLEAWRLASLAAQVFIQNPTDSLAAQIEMAERAVSLDSEYAFGWAVLGFLTAFKFPIGISEDRARDVENSLQATSRALQLDPRDPMSLTAHGIALQYSGRARDSLEFLSRSLRLNPSDTLTHCYYGRGATFSGNPSEAIAYFERFERLNPDDPAAHMSGMYHAVALMFLTRWEDAEHVARRANADAGGRNPWVLATLAIVCTAQGKKEAATRALEELARVAPHWDREFVDGFLSTCQEKASLMAPISALIKQTWPVNQGNA